jgi:hypothetical protein
MKRLWKVRVRHYTKKGEDKGRFNDAVVLVEADGSDDAYIVGFEAVMGRQFFGRDPKRCETMEAATVTLPLVL